MPQESSNVYSKIIDLSTYLDSVPGTTGFIPFVANKGPDNVLKKVNGVKSLVAMYGEEDINKFRKEFREGLMTAKQYASVSGDLYCMRVLPEDAQFSSLLIYRDIVNGKEVIRWENVDALTDEASINTALVDDGDKKPIAMFYGKYRGEYYNDFWIKMTPITNSDFENLDIYALNPRGERVIYKNYTVAFDVDAVDLSEESVYIEHVLDFYDDTLSAKCNEDNLGLIWGIESDTEVLDLISIADDPSGISFDDGAKVLVGNGAGAFAGHDDEIATWDEVGGSWIFAAPTSGDRYIITQDLRTTPSNDENIATFTTAWAFEAPEQGSIINVADEDKKYFFTGILWVEYKGLSSLFNASNATNDTDDEKPMAHGNEGSLIGNDGKVDVNEATSLLIAAYTGQIDYSVLNADTHYFAITFAPGYPRDVKDAAATMVIFYRPDVVLITDVGDVNSVENAIVQRNTLAYNDYHIAMYNNYSKIRHDLSGVNIWVSPTYHMGKIIPYNDQVANIWAAPANFRRAKLVGIKELRYYPNQNDRDDLYNAQLNSVVKWPDGYTIWEILTSQVRTSALSDLPVVRLVLYIEKALKDFTRFFIMEANNAITWDAINKEVTTFLNKIKREGGLESFSVDVGADDYEKKTKTCHVDVILKPTRVIEKIKLNLYIVN